MLDIKFVRENPEVVKQNIRNKFQDNKLELVDKVLELDKENREIKQEVEALRAERNKISKQIGALMAQGKKEEAEEVKKQVAASGTRIEELSTREKEVEEELLKDMMVIPNIIDPSVPIGKDGSMIFGIVIMIFLIFSSTSFSSADKRSTVSAFAVTCFFTSSASSLLPSFIRVPIILEILFFSALNASTSPLISRFLLSNSITSSTRGNLLS